MSLSNRKVCERIIVRLQWFMMRVAFFFSSRQHLHLVCCRDPILKPSRLTGKDFFKKSRVVTECDRRIESARGGKMQSPRPTNDRPNPQGHDRPPEEGGAGEGVPFFLQSSEKGDKSLDGSPGPLSLLKQQMSECLFKIIYLRGGGTLARRPRMKPKLFIA